MKHKVIILALLLVLSTLTIGLFIPRVKAVPTYYLTVDVGAWSEYLVEKADDIYFVNGSDQIEYLNTSDKLKFEISNTYEETIHYPNNSVAFIEERPMCNIYRNNEETIHEGFGLPFPEYRCYLIPFNAVGDDYLETLDDYMREVREAHGWNYSILHIEVQSDSFTIIEFEIESVYQRYSGVLLEYRIYEYDQNGTLIGEKLHLTLIDWVPEFPSALILSLLMIVTLVAVGLRKTIWTQE